MINQKHILMVNLPFSGHTNPTLELAKAFIAHGHHVTYVHSPEWQGEVEDTGAVFIPYDNYPDKQTNLQKEVNSWGAAYQTIQRIGRNYDCLVYEMLFFPGKSLADQLGIPSFRLFSTFTLNEKVLHDFGKTGGWYLTSIFRFSLLRKLISQLLYKKFDLRYNDIVQEISENTPELNFTYTIEAFQIYADDFNKKHYKYVGPSLGHRDDYALDLSSLQAPIIYISLGTLVNTSKSFFQMCITAFQEQPVSVIISIGNAIKKESLGKIPNNIHIYTYVPQLEVLHQADLFITHGGMNSVNEAIFYGVPMLVIPVGNDQPSVAQQVETLHLGKYLKRKGLNSIAIKEAVIAILKDATYKERLQVFQKKAQKAGGNEEVARLILNTFSCTNPFGY
ncbi:hypothetical protein KFZ56_06000 [Virgibacillus sp. NKC19-3]|uniref:macrolide family glycosyltransferase n=1 Tax=Virgibacillus saliphilus TaxID=2831674 RepID=UPI001C9B835D|nr:macrolide family glycosyltransferase [Virgibacillus sp. NKC19-3]MBY7142637.1 hypothetical protein [Virgibacillus sp. NKC19-3]